MALAVVSLLRSEMERGRTADTRAAAMANEIDTHLGRRLRRRRKLLGLTQQQIAAACGVRFQQIQKYECGSNRISAARLWQIAVTLGVAVDYFFEGLGEGEPERCESLAPMPQRPAVSPNRLDLVHTRDAQATDQRRPLLDLAK
jgi:transcriptional regulator with XRE-family HTH domain